MTDLLSRIDLDIVGYRDLQIGSSEQCACLIQNL